MCTPAGSGPSCQILCVHWMSTKRQIVLRNAHALVVWENVAHVFSALDLTKIAEELRCLMAFLKTFPKYGLISLPELRVTLSKSVLRRIDYCVHCDRQNILCCTQYNCNNVTYCHYSECAGFQRFRFFVGTALFFPRNSSVPAALRNNPEGS